VAGALVGAAIEPPPPRVVTYVRARPIPAQPVIVEEKVVVGQPLPSAVSVVAVPDYPKYGYALVNNERVIVEPSSRKVIQVIE
jgi:hypothetical protein